MNHLFTALAIMCLVSNVQKELYCTLARQTEIKSIAYPQGKFKLCAKYKQLPTEGALKMFYWIFISQRSECLSHYSRSKQ